MFAHRENQPVPDIGFKVIENGQLTELSRDSIFKDKTVVLFALPGAYTPTCTSRHVPRYDELAATFKANGIDDIVCLSVNDAYTMKAWQDSQQAANITFLADGNGEFTEAMGMLVDKSELGFGQRSWRYSMLVENGIIKKMFIEPNVPGDPFEVSDADTMLNYINPQAEKASDICVLTQAGCPYCAKAKRSLEERQMAYEEIVIGKHASHQALRAMTGKETVPQVFVDGVHIGGSEDLQAYLVDDKLNAA